VSIEFECVKGKDGDCTHLSISGLEERISCACRYLIYFDGCDIDLTWQR